LQAAGAIASAASEEQISGSASIQPTVARSADVRSGEWRSAREC